MKLTEEDKKVMNSINQGADDTEKIEAITTYTPNSIERILDRLEQLDLITRKTDVDQDYQKKTIFIELEEKAELILQEEY